MRISPLTSVLVSDIVLGIAIPVVALAGDDSATSDSTPVHTEAAADQFATAAADAPHDAWLREREHVASMLAPERGPIDLGPTRDELLAASAGAVLLDRDGTRISVIPTTRGDLCYVASTGDLPDAGGCIQEFPDSGVVVSMQAFTGGDMPDQVRGLTLDDVESVVVVTSDGERHEVAVDNGAFTWTARDPAQRLDHVESTRGGVVSKVESPAAGADTAQR